MAPSDDLSVTPSLNTLVAEIEARSPDGGQSAILGAGTRCESGQFRICGNQAGLLRLAGACLRAAGDGDGVLVALAAADHLVESEGRHHSPVIAVRRNDAAEPVVAPIPQPERRPSVVERIVLALLCTLIGVPLVLLILLFFVVYLPVSLAAGFYTVIRWLVQLAM